MHRRLLRLAISGLALLSACGPGTAVPTTTPVGATAMASPPAASATPSTGSNPMTRPTLAGKFPVDDSGRTLALRCYGEGSPTVFFESGGGAIEEFTREPLTRLLAQETQVCLYNRAGRDPSDPAPNRPREAEDVAMDFHALVAAAGIPPPYILCGRSFGGMIVTFYAQQHPDAVAGVVVFDTPAPAIFTEEEFPEGVWDHPDNVERLNVAIGYETRFFNAPVHFEAPLIYVSTTSGEAFAEQDRDYWLPTSETATSIVLDGGMEVTRTEADRLAEAILSLVTQARSSPPP